MRRLLAVIAVLWLGAACFGATPSAGSGAVLPSADYGNWYPKPGTPDYFTPFPLDPGFNTRFRQPTVYIPVWFDPASKAAFTKEGIPVYRVWRWWGYRLGCVSGACLVEVPREQAVYKFHLGSVAQIAALSKQYQHGYGSGYFAVLPGGVFYFGNHVKPVQGGGNAGWLNTIRFVDRGWAYACGWTDTSKAGTDAIQASAPWAMRNTNQSWEIPFADVRGGLPAGYAGTDAVERNAFASWYGPPWLLAYGHPLGRKDR